jgi:hypothetical protein
LEYIYGLSFHSFSPKIFQLFSAPKVRSMISIMADFALQATSTESLGILSKFPSEIRQVIFKFALEDTKVEFRTTRHKYEQQHILSIEHCQTCARYQNEIFTCVDKPPALRPIPLLQTSRIIRQETISAISHYKTIRIKTKESLSRFIDTVIKGDSVGGNEDESNNPRYLKLDFSYWTKHWLHGHPWHYWSRDDQLQYLERVLDDWAKRLINLPVCPRSTLIFKIALNEDPDVHSDMLVRAEIGKFLRRVVTRCQMLSKGRMKCVVQIRPALDFVGLLDWRRLLGSFVQVA